MLLPRLRDSLAKGGTEGWGLGSYFNVLLLPVIPASWWTTWSESMVLNVTESHYHHFPRSRGGLTGLCYPGQDAEGVENYHWQDKTAHGNSAYRRGVQRRRYWYWEKINLPFVWVSPFRMQKPRKTVTSKTKQFMGIAITSLTRWTEASICLSILVLEKTNLPFVCVLPVQDAKAV